MSQEGALRTRLIGSSESGPLGQQPYLLEGLAKQV